MKTMNTQLIMMSLLYFISAAIAPTFAVDVPDSVEIRILSEESDHLVVDISFPAPHFADAGGAIGQIATIPGCFQSDEPGKPALPFAGMPVVVPPGAKPLIRILSIEEAEEASPLIGPAPAIASVQKEKQVSDASIDAKYVFAANSAVYQQNRFYPGKRVVAGDVAIIRGVSILPVRIYPLLYNPAIGKIRFAAHIVLQIEYGVSTPAFQNPLKTDSAFESNVAASIAVNGSAVRTTLLPRKKIEKASPYFLSAADVWCKIYTDQQGIYSLSKENLMQSGLDVISLDPRNLSMYCDGEEIAILVRGEEDGRFDKNDVIEFYARSFKNYYAAENVYWLGVSGKPGKRMARADAAPIAGLPCIDKSRIRIHNEVDFYRRADFPGHADNERWFMDRLYAPASVSYKLNFPMLADTLVDCTLLLRLQGITSNAANPDHHAVATVNGQLVFDKTWDGRTALLDSASFSQSLLHRGDNVLQISAPGDENVLLDWQLIDYFDLEFMQENIADRDSLSMRIHINSPSIIRVDRLSDEPLSAYDISNDKTVRTISSLDTDSNRVQFSEKIPGDHRYLLVSDFKKRHAPAVSFERSALRDASNQADYLIITTPDFVNAVIPLADFRETQGLTTQIITVNKIYDEFGFGHPGDRPIRDFITYAYNSWSSPAPMYVLLVGDASWNPRQLGPDNENYNRDQQSDFVPTHLFEASVDHFEAASDNWFVCVDGEHDVLPDLFIGRLPVRDSSELAAVVQKLLKYETTQTAAPWSRTAAFVADAGEGGTLAFEDSSDAYLRDYIPGYFATKRLYVSRLGAPETRNQIMQTFGDGALTMNYFGHGSVGNWSAQSIFMRDDVPLLHENIYLPFVFTMSCINGYFVEPNEKYRALAEALLNEPGKGAIAVFSGSGEAYPSPLQPLARTLYASLYQHFDRVLGSITTKALLAMYSAFPQNADHLRFYLLFGDPAMRLPYYYEEDAPAYAGFAGQVTVHGRPADQGAHLLAFIDEVMLARTTITTDSGSFGPLYLAQDAPETGEKDGGQPGDSVLFKLVQAHDTLSLAPMAAWRQGEVQTLHLEAIATDVEKESVQFLVDQRIVGLDFMEGETIARSSVISANFAADPKRRNDDVQLLLNNELIDEGEYTVLTSGSTAGALSSIQFSAAGLRDGDYELTLVFKPVDGGRTSFAAGFRFAIKSAIALSQVVNFPNPFSEQTRFTFVLDNDESAFVKIKIYTVAGRLIRILDQITADVGYNEIEWDGRDAAGDKPANGVYFYKIIANDADGTAESIERLVIMH